MDVEQAKWEVIEAGHRLVESGLIARTWGNVSCRIDESRFAITPSGRSYDVLTPDDIVVVGIADLGYEGDIKPSSEKGIHAAVYALKPDVNFVIHTHQAGASIAGVLGKDVGVAGAEARELLGHRVLLAAYGLPGTKKLRKGVMNAVSRSEGRAVLMSHHGALVYGEDRAAAFAAAQALEDECRRFYASVSERTADGLGSSFRDGDGFIYTNGDYSVAADMASGRAADGTLLPVEAQWHLAIYRTRPDVNVIRGCVLPGVAEVARQGGAVKPLLDDFAQLAGVTVRAAEPEGAAIVRALKGRNAVLVKGRGALCCAGDADDAEAVEMVLEKGCDAYLAALMHGTLKPIAPLECRLMRFVYLKKYSKMKK